MAEGWHSHVPCHPPPQGHEAKLHKVFLPFNQTTLGCQEKHYLPPLATLPGGVMSLVEEKKLALIYSCPS